MIKLDIWFTQFGVRTQKLCKLQVPDSCCAEAAGRPASPRLAGPTPFPSTSFLATRPLGTLQWTPYALDIQANTKDMTGRLPPWIERPQLEANSINFSETKCGWFVMTIHYTMEVDWMDLVEILSWPASHRPAGLATPQVGPKQPITNCRRRSGASTRRSASNRKKS